MTRAHGDILPADFKIFPATNEIGQVMETAFHKVYPPDQHIRRFLGQWIQPTHLRLLRETPF
jgi:hypothetical protein